MIAERDGLPPHTQRLLFKGHQLEDGLYLKDYGIGGGAIINLVIRLFGGGSGGKVCFFKNYKYIEIVLVERG
jgi:hypothetical protein